MSNTDMIISYINDKIVMRNRCRYLLTQVYDYLDDKISRDELEHELQKLHDYYFS